MGKQKQDNSSSVFSLSFAFWEMIWKGGTEQSVFAFTQSRMKYEKVHSIYNRLLAIEDIDPTLVRSSLVSPHAYGLAPSACTEWGGIYRSSLGHRDDGAGGVLRWQNYSL